MERDRGTRAARVTAPTTRKETTLWRTIRPGLNERRDSATHEQHWQMRNACCMLHSKIARQQCGPECPPRRLKGKAVYKVRNLKYHIPTARQRKDS